VYEAEEHAFGGTDLDRDVAFTEVAALAERVLAGAWWPSTGAPPVEVRRARAGAIGSTARHDATAATVRIAAGQCTAATLAHELAHVLAGVGHGHDDRFRAAHVDLAAVLGGAVAGRRLRAAYRDFALGLSARAWPPPVLAEGDSFVVVP
jgi:hypothetical protein